MAQNLSTKYPPCSICLSWEVVTSNDTIAHGEGFLIDASSNAVSVTLPPAPTEGNVIGIKSIDQTNTITLLRNGSNIEGSATDLVWDVDGAGATLVYSNSTIGWTSVTEIDGSNVGSLGGFNWSTSNEVTTDQTPTTSNFGQRYLFTQSTTADRTITLPSVGTDEDNKWLVVSNFSKYTITIEASDSDTIGWPALNITAIEILPNTQVVVRYDHNNTKWEIAFKVGGQCRPSGTVLYLKCDIGTAPYSGYIALIDEINRHNVYTPDDTTAGMFGDSSDAKFGQNALYFDGSAGYFKAKDSADWDLFDDITDDVTISMWVNHDDAIGSSQVYMCQYQGGNDFWRLNRNSSGVLNLQIKSGGSIRVNIASTTTVPSGSYQLITLAKVGEYIGLYLNGTQIAYGQSKVYSFNASLFFGQRGDNVSEFFDGGFDDIVICQHNIFGAAPNVGLTDALNVDTLNPLDLVI